MTPVKQTKLFAPDAIGPGNCFAAAVASVLDLPLWMVPPFEDMFAHRDPWHFRVEQWAERVMGMSFERTDGHPVDQLPEYYIASGVSPRGVRHSVVFRNGQLAHDPHPSDGGLVGPVEWCWSFKPIANKEGGVSHAK